MFHHLQVVKWVYTVRTCSDGSLEHYKVCLVAHGFQQKHGCDRDETFAPMAHMTTVCTLLRWLLFITGSSQLDANNAFLNSELREEVYVHPSSVYSAPDGMVCCLHRSLHGLKQAPRACFTFVVTAAGFSMSDHDPLAFCSHFVLWLDSSSACRSHDYLRR